MQELDELIEAIGSRIPANPESAKNRLLADSLERDLRKYFKELEDAIPIDKLEMIYLKYVEQE